MKIIFYIKGTNFQLPFWILYTDYYQTAIAWSCTENLKLFHLEYISILSRKPYLNDLRLNELKDILNKNSIDTSNLFKNDLVGCM